MSHLSPGTRNQRISPPRPGAINRCGHTASGTRGELFSLPCSRFPKSASIFLCEVEGSIRKFLVGNGSEPGPREVCGLYCSPDPSGGAAPGRAFPSGLCLP